MSNRKIYHVSENNDGKGQYFYSSLKKAMTAISNMIHIETCLKKERELGRSLTAAENVEVAKKEPQPEWFQSGVLCTRNNTNYTIYVIKLDAGWPDRILDEVKT